MVRTWRWMQATGRAREAVAVMADRKDFFRQMAVQYRQLAEIAGNPEIKQRMLDMAAHYQAKADEDDNDEQ
jgi:hypothetical protein